MKNFDVQSQVVFCIPKEAVKTTNNHVIPMSHKETGILEQWCSVAKSICDEPKMCLKEYNDHYVFKLFFSDDLEDEEVYSLPDLPDLEQ